MGRIGTVAMAVVCAVVAVSLVILGYRAVDQGQAPPIIIEDARLDATIVVAVEGEVATPGVYGLPADARVGDALAAAGGTVAGADLAQVNPAARLTDGERLIVPSLAATVDADDPSSAAATGRSSSPPPTAVSTDGRAAAGATTSGADSQAPLDLNTATAAELEELPGIGPALAARIVAWREREGPFRSVDELAEIAGISARMVDEIRPLVTVAP